MRGSFVRESEPDALMFPSFQLSVVASQRGATAGTLKYPHKTTLIHKVLLYVEVQHPVPARSTQINTGERISQARKAVLANCFPAAHIAIMADTARTTSTVLTPYSGFNHC